VGGLTAIFTLGFAASFVAGAPALMLPIVVNFAIWTPLGLVLTSLALTGPIFSPRPS
jgi:multidrug transporter EmrE-like cation transporter